jgi:sulfonate transport system substrate-binding protein
LEQTSGDRIIQTWPFRFLSIMRTQYMKDHPNAAKRYVAALRASMFYIAQHKKQASVWFGKQLRLDPKIIRMVSTDDPNYNAKSINDIKVAVTPTSKKLISRWFAAAYKFGMIRTKIDPSVAFGN